MGERVVIFDLDETLGYFTELGLFYNIIQTLNNYNKLKYDDFFKIMDLYPEFLRPNIMNILNYIKCKKISGKCKYVIIYTNNRGPEYWCKMIAYYFNYKLNFKLFDKIIGSANKNRCRTSHKKKYTDLVRCLDISSKIKVCFIDNQHHKDMINKNVYYLYVNSYKRCIDYEVMADRYYNNIKTDFNKSVFTDNVIKLMNINNIQFIDLDDNRLEYEIQIGKNILDHIKLFFTETLMFQNF